MTAQGDDSMTALEGLLEEPSDRRRGCYVCGEKNVASVGVYLKEVGENGQVSGRSTSRTKSFCAVHAAELFSVLRERLLER